MKRHLWVLMPHLPFPLWNVNILKGIENKIGRYVAVDEDFHLTFDKRVARVLVELDVSHGLPAEVEILCKDRLLVQRLDYLHVPFRCSICREQVTSGGLVLLSRKLQLTPAWLSLPLLEH